MFFDGNGDSPARYELVNLQTTNPGTLDGVTVGTYDAALPKGHQFTMNNVSVIWRGRSKMVRLLVTQTSLSLYTYLFYSGYKTICILHIIGQNTF